MPARILIIEDDPASRELVRYLLNAAGHRVHLADDGGEALSVAALTDPDLILCDLQMPIADGYSVLLSLVRSPKWRGVPVIAVTAFSMPGDRDKVIAGGFTDYIAKPIDPEIFVAQVERFLPAALRQGSAS